MSGLLFSSSIAYSTKSLSRQAGGVVVPIRALAARVIERGGLANVYGLKDVDLEKDVDEWDGTPVHAVDPLFGGVAPALDAALRDASHHLLHLHGLWLYPSIAASNWRKRTGCPVVVAPHGMLDPWAMANSGWKKRLAMALYEGENLRGAACLHALNTAEAAAMRKLGLTNPIAIVPNGVKMPDYGTTTRPISLKNDDRNVLLFLGRLHPKKGLLETIDAWNMVISEVPKIGREWTLVIAGWDDGGHGEFLKAKIASLGLDNHVHVPGPVFGSEKVAMLTSASAFILASHSEGLPIAVLEAWSHGVPVFMTAACNLPEGFLAGASIQITTNAKEIASVLCNYLPDSHLSQVGFAGRELVERHYNWNRIGDEMIAVYQWLIDGGAAPASVITR